VNLVDFDMLYGHRNDAPGYARALEELDRALPRLLDRLRDGDALAITADHGCDPTTPSTDHSREYVPLLAWSPGCSGGALGTRGTFADLGATVGEFFGAPVPAGKSFLGALR
jgi:phosphopentomutase